MDAGKLDRRVALQRATESKSDRGGVTQTWATFATVWAQKIEARGDERFSDPSLVGKITRSFRIRWSSEVKDLTSKDRVMFEGVPHDIIAQREIGGRDLIELDCFARAEETVVKGS